MNPILLPIPMAQAGRVDIYSGVARRSGKLWASLHRAGDTPTSTVVVVVHPSSNFLGHYALELLAGLGVDAVGMNTRYIANDSALIMENCVVDLGACLRYLREQGYARIVLVGNSGGGGLVAFYQSQAEAPTVRNTPAGDPPDLTAADLPAADAVVELMAHPGRATVYTEWLDPAITDELHPFARDPDLDLFTRTPPFDVEFVAHYREAQRDRNRRITAWVRRLLDELPNADSGAVDDLPFVVHGTCADPRFVDLTLDPSDRAAGTLWGDPFAANFLPATLGHHTSLRSWLSQWSIDESNCDGPRHLGRVTVPVLVVYGTADQGAHPSHARALYDGVAHDHKELVAIAGANHYFDGQPELAGEACARIVDWLRREGLH